MGVKRMELEREALILYEDATHPHPAVRNADPGQRDQFLDPQNDETLRKHNGNVRPVI